MAGPGAVIRRSACLVALACAPAMAQDAGTRADALPGIARVERLVESLMTVARLPSFSLAVLAGDSVVYRAAFGLADLEGDVPATPGTRYPMASLSKMVTVTALARLVQDGRIDLDAPASRYLTDFPGSDALTARQLAGHLAGIGHYQPGDRMEYYRAFQTVTDALEVFRGSPRIGPPGTRYHYSTHGFTLLSAVMESAAGTPFLHYVDQAVLTPLGLTATGPRAPGEAPPSQAAGVYIRNGVLPVRVARPFDKSYAWAGAGYTSTPTDMAHLAGAWWSGFLDSAVVANFWTTQRTADGEPTGVGVGWRIGEDFAGRPIVHHSGSDQGTRTTLVLYPRERVAIATATNVVWSSSVEKNAQVLLAALRSPAGTPSIPAGRYYLSGEVAGDSAQAELEIEGAAGMVTTPAPMRAWFGALSVDTLPLYHVHGDLWALVTPQGIADLRLTPAGGAAAWSATRFWQFSAVRNPDLHQ